MNYLSLFSGIEAATAAWHPLGWSPVAFAEVDPFPSAVLAHHYPDVPNWGDVTKFKEWPDADVDVLVGGSPCQAFSVAGLRKGLDDPRGNLTLTYLAVVAKYRPQWVVWENVPGVLSIDGGRTFGAFLGGLAKLGYGWAYRVLDAYHFGTPLQRRRVFVVGCFGDWRCAAAVLLDRAAVADVRAQVAGVPCIDASGLAKRQTMPERGRCWTVHDGRGHRFLTPLEVERLLGFPDGYTDTTQTPIHARSAAAVEPCNEVRPDAAAVCGQTQRAGRGLRVMSGTDAASCGGSRSLDGQSARHRLSSLQHQAASDRGHGLGDACVGIPRRKRVADGPRYKALGNSMAVPVMAWIGRRIAAVDAIEAEREAA